MWLALQEGKLSATILAYNYRIYNSNIMDSVSMIIIQQCLNAIIYLFFHYLFVYYISFSNGISRIVVLYVEIIKFEE